MIYTNPSQSGAVVAFESRYGNYIGGEFVPPVKRLCDEVHRLLGSYGTDNAINFE
ncbi:hypothetical protein [Halomonas icarae]|uniref:Uncharacterized protein n=1 Tax=Halomonas icarae TaxID=2691040 RepID=A0A7X4VZN0_9GAMM|nr:hypothetical protein [Halomonas icarae]NAW13195.1 hypothetical protein [Halomonas icarae]